MESKEKSVLFVSPIDVDILKKHIEHSYVSYKCEICDKKLIGLNIILHKDFFLCGNCALEHKLEVKTITCYVYPDIDLSEFEKKEK